MPTGIPIADGIQAGICLAQTVVGLINAGETKREAALLNKTRPQYAISPLAGEDLSLAKSELANGMSAGAEQAYNNLNNQQFSSSLSAILKGGGDVNSVGDVYGNNQEGRLKLAMMKDQLRLQQIQNLTRASQSYQQEQQTAWQLNQFQPFQDKISANGQARMGAQQQIWQGVNTFGSAAIQGAQSLQEGNQFNQTFNGGGGFNGQGYSTGVPTETITDRQFPGANVLTERRTNPFGFQ